MDKDRERSYAMMQTSAAKSAGPVDRHPNSLSSFSQDTSINFAHAQDTSSRTRPQLLSNSGNANISKSNLQSTSIGTTSDEQLSFRDRKAKPPLGIYIPSFSNSGSYFLPSFGNTNTNGIRNSAVRKPVKRKPVPASASTIGDDEAGRRTSTAKTPNNTLAFPPRNSSLNSPLISPGPRSASISTPGHPNLVGVELVFRDLDKFPHGSTPPAFSPRRIDDTVASIERLNSNLNASTTNTIPTSISAIAPRNDQSHHDTLYSYSIASALHPESRSQKPITQPYSPQHSHSRSVPANVTRQMATLSTTQSKTTRPMQLGVTGDGLKSPDTLVPGQPQEAPKSPGIMASIFGWKGSSDSNSLPSSASSPANSPKPPPLRHAKTMPTNIDIPKANGPVLGSALGIMATNVPTLPTPPASSARVAGLEQELREISTELAGSIRREMELEDELDRLRAYCADHHAGYSANDSMSGRRTSDYFSDSGTTSSKYGASEEQAARIEELERGRRKAELEKAQFKLEMSGKIAEVMKQRRLAEDRVQALEEHVQVQSRSISAATSPAPSPVPIASLNASSDAGTEQQRKVIKNLEAQLEETRRKLSEEKMSRANMEELIGGMRYEIGAYQQERDRLRDDVVPLLESKIQELERGGAGVMSPRTPSVSQQQRGRKDSLNHEPREQLVQKVRDLEAQREALQKALRGLLERHRLTEKHHSRRLRAVQNELDKAVVGTRAVFGGGRSARGSGMLLGSGPLKPGIETKDGQPPNGPGLGWPGIFTHAPQRTSARSDDTSRTSKGLNIQLATTSNMTSAPKPQSLFPSPTPTPTTATSPKPPTSSILDPPGMFRRSPAWLT